MSFPVVAGFILAAGEGRRLRPATLSRPKALIPFAGVPLLELVVSQLQPLPLCGVIVNAWYLADQVADACRALAAATRLDLRVSREARLLDTGGGLRHGARLLPEAEHFLVHNADVVLDYDLRQLLARHLASGAAATVLLVPERGPRTVTLDADGRVGAFRLPHGAGQFTFAGVHVLRRDVLERLPADQPASIITAYEAASAAGQRVLGLSTGDAFWSDLGQPADYLHAHGEVADRGFRFYPRLRDAQVEQARRRAECMRQGIRCTGALGLGRDLSLVPGAQLHNAVLWDGTVLGKPVLYADSIFTGPGVPVPPPVDERRQPDPRIYFSLGAAPAEVQCEPLRKQGSGRRYCRLSAKGRHWVWCAYTHERRENAAFAALADFLERLGVRIPTVVAHLGDVGELVSQDLGNHDLQEVNDPAQLEALLADTIGQIARLHVLGDRAAKLEELPLQPGFTKGLYDWERDYFREHLLGRVLDAPDLWAAAAAEYCALRNRLLAEPAVPIHRDLQSANVMVVDGQTYLIDFQGLRPGAAVYDLAALLFDPYKCHPAERRIRLWRVYQQAVEALGGLPPDDELLSAGAVQRLLQALGAYGKLWLTDGLDWYRQFILPGLDLLRQAADEGGYPQLAALARAALAQAVVRLPTLEPGPGPGP